jgi:2,4'-dihydroxyacetophenone dioxygenase
MSATEPEPANPLHTADMPWIPSGPGNSFRPLRFATDGWSELMRVEPGHGVALHRHSGPVHAFNLAGKRRILGCGELVGPGDYVYEPGGMIDGWKPSATNRVSSTSTSSALLNTSMAPVKSSPSPTQLRSAPPT